MSEASGRVEMERRLVQRSLQDDAFRRRLLEDPRATVEQELRTRLPEGVEVRAVEETADTIYLVLPGRSADVQGGELSDQELEAPPATASAMCPSITDDPGECPQPLEP